MRRGRSKGWQSVPRSSGRARRYVVKKSSGRARTPQEATDEAWDPITISFPGFSGPFTRESSWGPGRPSGRRTCHIRLIRSSRRIRGKSLEASGLSKEAQFHRGGTVGEQGNISPYPIHGAPSGQGRPGHRSSPSSHTGLRIEPASSQPITSRD